jgi:hypothetical protein
MLSRDRIRTALHEAKTQTQDTLRLLALKAAARLTSNPDRARQYAVALTYKELLGRMPDQKGWKIYDDQLRTGRTLFEVRTEIGTSGEANKRLAAEVERKGRAQVILGLYPSVIGRKIDLVGVKEYIRSGRPVREVRDSLLESEEHKLRSQRVSRGFTKS